MSKRKDKQKQLKNKRIKNSVLFVENGKVYDIYSGKVFEEKDIFDNKTNELKDIIKKKYG
jgi:hypothetical protein